MACVPHFAVGALGPSACPDVISVVLFIQKTVCSVTVLFVFHLEDELCDSLLHVDPVCDWVIDQPLVEFGEQAGLGTVNQLLCVCLHLGGWCSD